MSRRVTTIVATVKPCDCNSTGISFFLPIMCNYIMLSDSQYILKTLYVDELIIVGIL